MKIGEYGLNHDISIQCKQLIVDILKFQPEERISIEGIEESRWVRKMEGLMIRHYMENQDYEIGGFVEGKGKGKDKEIGKGNKVEKVEKGGRNAKNHI